MLTHHQIWAAVDALALRTDLTPSGLAKLAGLDPTAFNKSKRKTSSGKERWPSTESISKVLQATGYSLEGFVSLVTAPDGNGHYDSKSIPFIETDKLKNFGFSEDEAQFEEDQFRQIEFPDLNNKDAFAIEVNGNSMQPFYRDGDILIVSPNSEMRRRDRILIKTKDEKILVGALEHKTTKAIEYKSFMDNDDKQICLMEHVQWVARILWASQ
ncbi:MAG: helix-turn-helix transcriptional regulator [Pseudomonadota bacterium]